MSGESRARPARPARRGASGEVNRLRTLLAEARATLGAIQRGDVDAVVVEGKLGPRVYTLDGAEFDYRVLIESMNEGALVLTPRGVILYANRHFARMVERPLAQIMGCSLHDLLSAPDRVAVRRLLKSSGKGGASLEVLLQRPPGTLLPARVSIQRFPGHSARNASIGMVESDLTEFRQREDLLRRLSHGLMQRQEAERLQIASDLGDNIEQTLCSILVRCQILAQGFPPEMGPRKEANEFVELLRTTASEVQRISDDLRPHGLEILGLVPALQGVVAEFGGRMGVPIQVRCATLRARLPARAELACYRVLQEALRNVEQHAGARCVSVTLSRRGSVVQLTIKDDGVGFDARAPQAGWFGLLSMRERATAVGGSLAVRSRISGGTEVCLSLPLLSRQAATGRDRPRQASLDTSTDGLRGAAAEGT